MTFFAERFVQKRKIEKKIQNLKKVITDMKGTHKIMLENSSNEYKKHRICRERHIIPKFSKSGITFFQNFYEPVMI